MKLSYIWALILLVAILFVLLVFFGNSILSPTAEQPQQPAAGISKKNNAEIHFVAYTDDGFEPRSISITKDDIVVFNNRSSGKMWVASNPHPVHDAYPNTDEFSCQKPKEDRGGVFDSCIGIPKGLSWNFTFDKSGTWSYHDHLKPENQGTVIVE